MEPKLSSISIKHILPKSLAEIKYVEIVFMSFPSKITSQVLQILSKAFPIREIPRLTPPAKLFERPEAFGRK